MVHENVFFPSNFKKPEKHVSKLNKGKFIKKSYLVGFLNESERLEIFLSYNFLQKIIREQRFTLVAMFSSEDEAFEYIRVLSEISMRKYNSFEPFKTINELIPYDYDIIAAAFEEDVK